MKDVVRILSVAFSVCQALFCYGQTASDTVDVNEKTFMLSGPGAVFGKGIYEASPAASLYRYGVSYTEIGASYRMRDENEALLMQLGDRFDAGAFTADSWLRLDSASAAFASVEYVNGRTAGVLWNSSSDFLLLYPYVTADTVGGSLSYEKYFFSGGYSRRDGVVSYGVYGSYRALHEYRRIDPRPRNITSDFKAAVSAGCSFGEYILEAAFSVRLYRQISDVDFYDPSGANTSEIPMTGLGTYYERFSGTGAYLGTYHKGNGYCVSIGLVPENRRGWLAGAEYDVLTIGRLLSNQNDVPITSLALSSLSLYAAYRGDGLGVYVQGRLGQRLGYENVIDNGSSNMFNVLGSYGMYLSKNFSVIAGGYRKWKRGSALWSVSPEAGWRSFLSEYLYPRRVMDCGGISFRFPVSFTVVKGPWLIGAGLSPEAYVSTGGTLDISPLGAEAAMTEMVGVVFSTLSSSAYGGRASLRLQRSLNRTMAVFIRADYGFSRYSSGNVRNLADIKIGICF